MSLYPRKRKKTGFSVKIKNIFGYVVVKLTRVMSGLGVRAQPAVLCVATTGLGDSLMITPAIKALKTSMPHLKITMLVTDASYHVFESSVFVDDFLFFRKGRGLIGLFACLVRSRFSCSFIFHASDRLVWVLASASAGKVIAGDWQSIYVPRSLITNWYQTPHREHRIISHLKMTKAMFSRVDLSETDMVFDVQPSLSQNARKWLLGQTESLEPVGRVGLFPGAKDRFKCWSIENFLELGRALEQKNIQVVIVGSGHDRGLTKTLVQGLSKPLLFQNGLHELAALLSNLNCFVTNDSGPMHLALAVNVPVISLFGPTDHLETGPISSISQQLTIQRSVTCFPSVDFPITESQCFNKKCANPICINQIPVGEVLENVLLVLNGLSNDASA